MITASIILSIICIVLLSVFLFNPFGLLQGKLENIETTTVVEGDGSVKVKQVCDAGTFIVETVIVDGQEQYVCAPCATFSYTSEQNLRECKIDTAECQRGQYKTSPKTKEGECKACEEGSFSPAAGQYEKCIPHTQVTCQQNQYLTVGSSINDNLCFACPTNTSQTNKDHTIEYCSPDTIEGIIIIVVAEQSTTSSPASLVANYNASGAPRSLGTLDPSNEEEFIAYMLENYRDTIVSQISNAINVNSQLLDISTVAQIGSEIISINLQDTGFASAAPLQEKIIKSNDVQKNIAMQTKKNSKDIYRTYSKTKTKSISRSSGSRTRNAISAPAIDIEFFYYGITYVINIVDSNTVDSIRESINTVISSEADIIDAESEMAATLGISASSLSVSSKPVSFWYINMSSSPFTTSLTNTIGCKDSSAVNYNASANVSGECVY